MAADPPDVSAVVVSLCGDRALEHCLGHLKGQVERCLVLLRDGDIAAWRAQHPSVDFLVLGSLPVPLRRLEGIRRSQSRIVMLLEDTTWPLSGWWEAARAALADPAVAVVGGPVAISARLPSRLQALGWTEYPPTLDRMADGAASDRPIEATRLFGNNLAVRRQLVLDLLRNRTEGLVECQLIERIHAAGWRVLYVPGMASVYAGEDWRGARLATRFQHGRLYGGSRTVGRGWPVRLALVACGPLLPPFLWWRSAAPILRIRPRRALLRLLGWCLALTSAWSLGEIAGYIAGPGRSLASWR